MNTLSTCKYANIMGEISLPTKIHVWPYLPTNPVELKLFPINPRGSMHMIYLPIVHVVDFDGSSR